MAVVDGFALDIQFELAFVVSIGLDEVLPVVLDYLFLQLLPAHTLVHFHWHVWVWM